MLKATSTKFLWEEQMSIPKIQTKIELSDYILVEVVGGPETRYKIYKKRFAIYAIFERRRRNIIIFSINRSK